MSEQVSGLGTVVPVWYGPVTGRVGTREGLRVGPSVRVHVLHVLSDTGRVVRGGSVWDVSVVRKTPSLHSHSKTHRKGLFPRIPTRTRVPSPLRL